MHALAQETRPAATATGSFEITPLAQLLVYASDRRLTGSFAFSTGGEEVAWVTIDGGEATNAKVPAAPLYLGQVLYELGAVDGDALNASLADLARSRALHGKLLVDKGLVGPRDVERALGHQIFRKVHHLFQMAPSTTYAFYNGHDVLARWGKSGGARVGLLPVAWRGIKECPPWSHVNAVIRRVEHVRARATSREGLARLALDPDEAAVAEMLLHRPFSRRQLVQAAPTVDEKRVTLLFFALVISKAVALEGAPAPAPPRTSSAPSMVAAVPQGRPSPAASAIVAEGPPRTAEARAGAPDAAPSGEYRRVDSFHLRAAVAPAGASPGTSSARGPDVTASGDAAEDLARARLCLLRGDLAAAERLAQAALRADGRNATALAVLASVELARPSEGYPDAWRQAFMFAQRALTLYPDHAEALLCRARVHVRAGNGMYALSDLRRVVAKDPNNIDAARELRLVTMRLRNGTLPRRTATPPAGMAAQGGGPARPATYDDDDEPSTDTLVQRLIDEHRA